MTAFDEITTSGHRDVYIYLSYEELLKNLEITILSSFEKNTVIIFTYSAQMQKKYLMKHITKQRIEEQGNKLHNISKSRKLTMDEKSSTTCTKISQI